MVEKVFWSTVSAAQFPDFVSRAVRLGMERVKVKNGLMIVHFVGDAASPFYKSEVFSELLRRVTRRPDKFVLKQHNNRLAMTVRNVKDIEDAYKTLQQLCI